MHDPAHRATDELIARMEKEIAEEYKKAHEEMVEKTADYFRRFEKKDAKWQQWVESGRKTEEQYKQWETGQVLVGKRWSEMRDTLAQDYVNARRIAERIVDNTMPSVYAINHAYGTFEIEKGSLIDTSYTLYSHEAVERMWRDNPKLYQKPGRKVSQQIKDGKLKEWNRKQIQSVMTQGVLQGESIPNLTKRLERVTAGEHKAAIRNARTMATGIQNAGRIDAYKRANDLGIKTRKQWLATLDSRTRHEHRDLDGQIVDNDEPFTNGFGEIMYPGDPDADAANIYNCRCTLLAAIEGHEIDTHDLSLRHTDNLEEETWEEWHDSHEVISHPITKQEDIAAAMRQAYINEYGGSSNPQETPPETPPESAPQRTVVNGTDITETWERRPDQFDFEIEDVMNAQGFDGLPRVVSREEFERAVMEANGGEGFIAQRTYSAPDQETLDAYRDQLYNGKWYVDCSTGGAQYGQGMYCAADYTGTLSEGIQNEMEHYKSLGEDRYPEAVESARNQYINKMIDGADSELERVALKEKIHGNTTPEEWDLYSTRTRDQDRAFSRKAESIEEAARNIHGFDYTETMTLDPSAKIITYNDAVRLQYDAKLEWQAAKEIKLNGIFEDWKAELDEHQAMWRRGEITAEEGMRLDEESMAKRRRLESKASTTPDILERGNVGSFAAAKGYDAINAEGHGESASYTVILNRTKTIILGE